VTFLLNKDTAGGYRVGPSRAITSYSGGLGASFEKSALENNANFRLQRETVARRDEVARTAARALGQGPMRRLVEEQNAKAKAMGLSSKVIEPSNDPAEMAYALGSNGSKAILDLARQEVAKNPSAFRGIDFTEEGIDKFVAEKLQAEHQDAVDALEMMPSGRFSAELIGGMAGMTADIKNAPFLFLGGGSGSILKVFAREAMLNVTAEAAFIPDQFKMADVLDIPEPDVLTNLLLAAGAGGALGVGVEALGRGLRYAMTMGRKPTPVGADPMTFEAAVGEAETALMQGDDPQAAAAAALGPETAPQAAMSAPEEAEVALMSGRSVEEAVAGVMAPETQKAPVAPTPEAAGPESQPTFRAWFGNSKAVDPNNRPLTVYHGTYADFDQFSLDQGGGETGAIDAQGAIFFSSNPDLASSYAEVVDPYAKMPVMNALDRLARGRLRQAEDWLGKKLFGIDPTDGANVRAAYLRMENPEVINMAGRKYDEGDYAIFIDRAKADGRDGLILKNADDGMGAGQTGDVYIVFSPDQVRSKFQEQPAREPLVPDPVTPAAFERTAAGDQALIPGVAPVAPSLTRPAPVRGPQEADSQIGGMFDLANLSMRDMFDSPVSPKAQEANNARVAELRRTVEADGNFPLGETGEDGLWRGMTADDGRQINTLADALDEIDQMDALAREIELCRIGKATPNDAG
jgi:hypothetical protein